MILVRRIRHFRGLMGDSLKTRASWKTEVLSCQKRPTGRHLSSQEEGGELRQLTAVAGVVALLSERAHLALNPPGTTSASARSRGLSRESSAVVGRAESKRVTNRRAESALQLSPDGQRMVRDALHLSTPLGARTQVP
jgi:hypothetical protein